MYVCGYAEREVLDERPRDADNSRRGCVYTPADERARAASLCLNGVLRAMGDCWQRGVGRGKLRVLLAVFWVVFDAQLLIQTRNLL